MKAELEAPSPNIGEKFRTDGVVYKITKITKNRIFATLAYPHDLICLDDTGGIMPPETTSATIEEYVVYRNRYPEMFTKKYTGRIMP